MPSDKSPAEWSLEHNPETARAVTKIPSVKMTVGAEAANVINVALQVVDGEDMPLKQQLSFFAWLSSAAGGAVAGAAPGTGVAVGTDGIILIEYTADLVFELLTDAVGVIDLDIGDVATPTFYLNVQLPGGAIVSSDAITFA